MPPAVNVFTITLLLVTAGSKTASTRIFYLAPDSLPGANISPPFPQDHASMSPNWNRPLDSAESPRDAAATPDRWNLPRDYVDRQSDPQEVAPTLHKLWNRPLGFVNSRGDFSFPKKWYTTLSKSLDFSDRKSPAVSVQELTFPKNSFHPKEVHHELRNELGDNSKTSHSLSQIMLMSNVIPNIPVRLPTDEDRTNRYSNDKLRKMKVITESLKRRHLRERMKLAFAKALKRMAHEKYKTHHRALKELIVPEKFRRATLFSLKPNYVRVGSKPSFTVMDIPETGGRFGSKTIIPFKKEAVKNGQLLSFANTKAFIPKYMNDGFKGFRPKVKSSSSANDVLVASFPPPHPMTEWSSFKSLKPFSFESPQQFQSQPSTQTDRFGPPGSINPDTFSLVDPKLKNDVFSEPGVPSFYSSIPQSPSPANGAFEDSFQDYPEGFASEGEWDSEPMADTNGFSSQPFSASNSGGFITDDKDCDTISTKTCQSELDCSCSGFYTCKKGRCHIKQETNDVAVSQPASDMWHNQPFDLN